MHYYHLVPTSFTCIIDEHNLHKQDSGGAVDDAVHGPQQGAPGFVVKHDDDAGVGQVVWVHLGLTAEHRKWKKERRKASC